VRTVNVQFKVQQANPPKLMIDQDHLSFTYATTSVARSQTVTVSNEGGSPLSFKVTVTLEPAQSGNWLTISPLSGTATPTSPVLLTVRSDPGGFPPGTYRAHIDIISALPDSGARTVAVTMTITSNPLVLSLSQSGLTFTAVQGVGVVPGQSFGVLNLGSGVLSWIVNTSTLERKLAIGKAGQRLNGFGSEQLCAADNG